MVVAEMSAMVGGGDDDGARGLIELLFLLVLLLSLFVVLSSPSWLFSSCVYFDSGRRSIKALGREERSWVGS